MPKRWQRRARKAGRDIIEEYLNQNPKERELLDTMPKEKREIVEKAVLGEILKGGGKGGK